MSAVDRHRCIDRRIHDGGRLIDYWLHIGLELLTWAFRRQIGLRTWRNLPVEDPMESVTAELSIRKELCHEN